MATQKDMQERSGTPVFGTLADVIRVESITPRMRRITLGGEGLLPLTIGNRLPADAIKLYIPPPGRAGFKPEFGVLPSEDNLFYIRAYTIRRFQSEPLELDIDIFLHGDTPGSRWARSVQPGEQIGFVGPRHDDPRHDAGDWLLYIGDETAIPAISAIVEQLPANKHAYLFIEVTDETDEVPISSQASLTITWVHRKDTPAGQSDLLAQAVRNFESPAGKPHVWIAGETGTIRNIRGHLQKDRGLKREDIHASGYWRYGLNNQEFDRMSVQEYQAGIAAGSGIANHHDVDQFEFSLAS